MLKIRWFDVGMGERRYYQEKVQKAMARELRRSRMVNVGQTDDGFELYEIAAPGPARRARRPKPCPSCGFVAA